MLKLIFINFLIIPLTILLICAKRSQPKSKGFNLLKGPFPPIFYHYTSIGWFLYGVFSIIWLIAYIFAVFDLTGVIINSVRIAFCLTLFIRDRMIFKRTMEKRLNERR